MLAIVTLLAFIFVVVVLFIIWQEQRHSKLQAQRFAQSHNPSISAESSLYEKIDCQFDAMRQKRLAEQNERPSLRVLIVRIILYLSLYYLYLYTNGRLFESVTTTILYSLAIIVLLSAMYYFLVLPQYYYKLEIEIPRYIELFSQEIGNNNNITAALANTKNYANMEFSNICSNIAKLTVMGQSLETAIIKNLASVKSEGMVLFLSALIIHDRTGGRLNYVLANIAHLMRTQNDLTAEIKKELKTSKMAIAFSIVLSPLFFLFLKNIKPDAVHYFWTDPIGLACSKAIIFLYFANLLISYFLLRSEKL